MRAKRLRLREDGSTGMLPASPSDHSSIMSFVICNNDPCIRVRVSGDRSWVLHASACKYDPVLPISKTPVSSPWCLPTRKYDHAPESLPTQASGDS
jgi:hypothetical protein